jgi:hypothetical protein
MDPGDGTNADLPVELDEEDLSPDVRRFLELIAQRDGSAETASERRRQLERERRVTRFAWTCEELDVAFADLRADPETIALLVDHGVRSTLDSVRWKCDELLRLIDGAGAPDAEPGAPAPAAAARVDRTAAARRPRSR